MHVGSGVTPGSRRLRPGQPIQKYLTARRGAASSGSPRSAWRRSNADGMSSLVPDMRLAGNIIRPPSDNSEWPSVLNPANLPGQSTRRGRHEGGFPLGDRGASRSQHLRNDAQTLCEAVQGEADQADRDREKVADTWREMRDDFGHVSRIRGISARLNCSRPGSRAEMASR